MTRTTVAYEATITEHDALKWIIERKGLEAIKEDATRASLLWKPFYYAGSIEPGIKLVRIYRVSMVTDGAGGRAYYHDVVGYAANGKYYPRQVWWLMKEWYKEMPEWFLNLPYVHLFIEDHIRDVMKERRKGELKRFLHPPKFEDGWRFVHLDYSAWRHLRTHKGE